MECSFPCFSRTRVSVLLLYLIILLDISFWYIPSVLDHATRVQDEIKKVWTQHCIHEWWQQEVLKRFGTMSAFFAVSTVVVWRFLQSYQRRWESPNSILVVCIGLLGEATSLYSADTQATILDFIVHGKADDWSGKYIAPYATTSRDGSCCA